MQTIQKILKPIAGTAAALAILAMAGCMSTPDRSAGRVLDDKMITSKVKGALDDAPVYKFHDVKVATYKGVVQLSGFVDTPEQKQKASEIVKRVEWVSDVVNNISLKPKDQYPSATGKSSGERNTSVESSTTTTTPSSDRNSTYERSTTTTNRTTNPNP